MLVGRWCLQRDGSVCRYHCHDFSDRHNDVHGLQSGRECEGGQRDECHVDEDFFRKISSFSGENWRDWSFQAKATAKSSSKDAGKLLDQVEEQTQDTREYSSFAEDAARAEQMSGELFENFTQLSAAKPLQVLHTCEFSGVQVCVVFERATFRAHL